MQECTAENEKTLRTDVQSWIENFFPARARHEADRCCARTRACGAKGTASTINNNTYTALYQIFRNRSAKRFESAWKKKQNCKGSRSDVIRGIRALRRYYYIIVCVQWIFIRNSRALIRGIPVVYSWYTYTYYYVHIVVNFHTRIYVNGVFTYKLHWNHRFFQKTPKAV